ARQLRITDLVRSWTEQLSARGMVLRDEDLLVDEPQVVGVDDEALADGRALRLRQERRLRCEERNAGGRQNQRQHRDDGTVPGPRPPQPETIRRSHMPSPQ